MSSLVFRPATLEDAELLLGWRNDPQTRRQSHTNAVLQYRGHMEWLEESLKNPARSLTIAQMDGIPAGTVRLDKAGGVYTVSWTVAPSWRGKGVGKKMLKAMLDTLSLPAAAEIKSDNVASRKMAEYAGMKLEREENGVAHYRFN